MEPAPEPDAFLADGNKVEVTGVKLRVMHTPRPHAGERLLLHGRHAVQRRHALPRLHRPHGPAGRQLRAGAVDIVDKLLALPDETVVLPGHMDETRIGHERKTNPFVLEELARRASS